MSQESTTRPAALESSLTGELARLRRSVRGFFLAEGAARLVLILAGCAVVAICADYFLTLSSSTRAVVLGLICVVAAERSWRLLGEPLRLRLGRQTLAELLERAHPALGGRLLAAVDLAGDSSLAAGEVAPDLARSAAALLSPLGSGSVLRVRVLGAEAAMLACAALLVGGVCTSGRGRTLVSTGLVRLLLPTAERPWPRRTRLELEMPAGAARVAQREPVELVVRVSGTIPEAVWLNWRGVSGARGSLRCAPRSSTDGGRLFSGTIPKVLESFEVYARGGDGRSQSVKVIVVERPFITGFFSRLVPPEYMQSRLAPGEQTGPQIRAHQGTRVTLRCTANKPLASSTRMELVVVGRKPRSVPVTVAGSSLTAEFTAETSAVGRFRLTDTDGFAGAEPQDFDLRCIPDNAPVLEMLSPRTDKKVAPGARISLAVLASDDFGLGEIKLRFRSARSGKDHEILLGRPAEGALRHVVRQQWDLAPLKLSPGDRLAFYAVAHDLRGKNRPGLEGRSGKLHLEVATPSEVAESLHRWQVRLSGQVEELLKLQRAARANLEAARKAEPARRREIAAAVLLEQDGVHRRTEHCRQEFGKLVEEVYSNRLTRPELEMRLRLVSRGFRGLLEGSLPAARTALAAARGPASKVLDVTNAVKAQDGALSAIEGIVGLLREWGDVEFILIRLRRVAALQAVINTDTTAAAKGLLGKSLGGLAEGEKALLAALSGRQAGRRDETSMAIRDLQRLVDQVKASQAQFAQRVLAVLRYAQRKEVVMRMGECAVAIEKNRCASILGKQKEVLAALEHMARRLEAALKPESYALPGEEEVAEPLDIDTLMTQLEQAVRPLIDREIKIRNTVLEVDGARPKDKPLPRKLAIQLGVAARSQKEIEAKTSELLESVRKQRTVLFPMILGDVLRDMREAGKLLGAGRSGVRTQGVIENIIAALQDIVSASSKEVIITEIKHVWAERFPGAPPAELVFIEDIRLLRLLQAALNRKTVTFDRERAGAAFEKLDENRRARLKALGGRQMQLAELAGKIKGSAALSLEKMLKEKQEAKDNKEKYEERPDIEKALAKASGAKLPIRLMQEVAKVIREEHVSGKLVQKNQKVILQKLDETIRGMISMVLAVSDMPDQPPAPPGPGGEPDFLKPPPDLTHLTGGPVGQRSQAEKRAAAKEQAWGKLPPRLREAILQARGGRIVGRYRDLVRLYYRTLAGEK